MMFKPANALSRAGMQNVSSANMAKVSSVADIEKAQTEAVDLKAKTIMEERKDDLTKGGEDIKDAN